MLGIPGALAEDEAEADMAGRIRWRDGAPLAFVHDERLYMVRRVVARGVGWWRLIAVAGRSGPPEPFELVRDPVTDQWTVVRLPGDAADLPESPDRPDVPDGG